MNFAEIAKLLDIPFEHVRKDGSRILVNLTRSYPNYYFTEENDEIRTNILKHIEETLIQFNHNPFSIETPHICGKGHSLARLAEELNRRYEMIAKSRYRNIDGYRKADPSICTYVIIVEKVEELSPEELESLSLIARKGRAAGLHAIIAAKAAADLPKSIQSHFWSLDR